MAYGYFKDLPKRTTSDKVLHDNRFDISKNKKYDGYWHRAALMVHIFLIKTLLLLTEEQDLILI